MGYRKLQGVTKRGYRVLQEVAGGTSRLLYLFLFYYFATQ